MNHLKMKQVKDQKKERAKAFCFSTGEQKMQKQQKRLVIRRFYTSM